MVASFDEITTELIDRSPIEENIIPDITFNYKIRLTEKLAPLYIFFSYPENQHNKALSLYISFENKDPSQNSNMASYFNPNKICIQGAINPENGKLMFKHEYLYLAFLSKSEMPVKVKITPKFK